MPQNFIGCDRDQVLLLPPSLRDWLPEDHLAWTVLDAVGELELAAFYAAYRADGHGRAAYEPSMMVALLLYAYARGNRSSRQIERACVEDVAYRVIAGNVKPDHSTIAEFRRRHETALGEVFSGVLGLCARAGLVNVGVVAVDGTKILASASHERNVDYGQLAKEILADAARIDAEEDELYGDARGDELPEHLRTAEGRRAALREAKRRLDEERKEKPAAQRDEEAASSKRGRRETGPVGDPLFTARFDDALIERARGKGRRRWLVEARQQLDEHRRVHPWPVPRSRSERLLEAERRFTEQLDVELQASRAYDAWRARRIKAGVSGSKVGGSPKPYVPPEEPAGKINLTDPDSRIMQTTQRWVQGYNAQAAVAENQIIIAAEVTVDSPDFGHLDPIVSAAEHELHQAGVSDRPGAVVADAGYWHKEQMEAIVSRGIPVIIPPDANTRQGTRPGWNGGLYAFMRRVIASEEGGRLYRQRQTLVEPVFGDIKFNRQADRFKRRGRAAVRSEWRLITATHNLLKLHRHRIATNTA